MLLQYCTSTYVLAVTPVLSLSAQPQTAPGLSPDAVCVYQPSTDITTQARTQMCDVLSIKVLIVISGPYSTRRRRRGAPLPV